MVERLIAEAETQSRPVLIVPTASSTKSVSLKIEAPATARSTAAAHSGSMAITVAHATGTGAGGLMTAKGDFAVINLAQNDTLQLTAKVQFT